MSVFALISSGQDRNIVDSDQAFQDAGGLEGRTLLIKNLDPTQLSSPSASEDSNTSYDLSVGQEYQDHRDIGKSELPSGERFWMKLSFAVILFLGIFPALLTGQTTEDTTPAAVPQNSTQAATPSPAVQTPAQPAKSGEPLPAQNQLSDSMPRRYVELWNTGDFNQMESLFSPPVALVSRGNRVLLTSQMLRRVITAWRKSMPDLNFKIEDTIAEGDKVAMRLSFTGTYKERLFPGTATPTSENPRIVRSTEMLMFHLKDGKIDQIWEEYDEVKMHLLMGGSWHTNEELEAPGGRLSKPAQIEAPAATLPPKP
jgi:predicted ester cyclase